MQKYLFIYLIAINVISFLAFYIDKQKAVSNCFRIAESILIMLSAIGGFIGSVIAIYTIRHKNRKVQFLFKLYLVLAVELLIVIYKLDLIK